MESELSDCKEGDLKMIEKKAIQNFPEDSIVTDIKREPEDDSAESMAMPEFVKAEFEDFEGNELEENILLTEEPVCDPFVENYIDLKSELAVSLEGVTGNVAKLEQSYRKPSQILNIDSNEKLSVVPVVNEIHTYLANQHGIAMPEVIKVETKDEPEENTWLSEESVCDTSQENYKVLKSEPADYVLEEHITNTSRHFEKIESNAMISYIPGCSNHDLRHSTSTSGEKGRNKGALKEESFEASSGCRSNIQLPVLVSSTKFHPERGLLGSGASMNESEEPFATEIKITKNAKEKCSLRNEENRENSAYPESDTPVAHRLIKTKEKRYKCSKCEKPFSTRRTYTLHMHIHTGEKLYKCSQCDQSFSRCDRLTSHMRSHTGEKPHKCSQCDRAFAGGSTLLRHIRIHTGEKPYQCNHCGKSFSRNGTLTNHMRIHTGDKPYKCNQCSKAFSKKDTLNTHMRIHTGEKPYKCSQCDRAYTHGSNLSKHVRSHTGENLKMWSMKRDSFQESNTH